MTGDRARGGWLVGRWRRSLPALVTLGAVLVMTAPLLTPGPLMPHLGLLAVLTWSLFQPQLMRAWTAFGIGLVCDAVLATPLGIAATLLPLVTVAVAALERRFGNRPFDLDWVVAATLIFTYQILSWVMLMFVEGPRPFAPLLVQAATTALTYPAAVWVCARVQRRWVEA